MTVVAPASSPSHGVALAVSSIALGAVCAAVPSFSGLALIAVLLTGGLVGMALFDSPYPAHEGIARPARAALLYWLVWTLALIAVEMFVALARDELRWPPLSEFQDAITTANPVGRFLAGSAWTVAGFGLIALAHRFPSSREATKRRRATACLAGGSMLILAAASVADGPMLEPRDATTSQAQGIYDVAVMSWPLTAWLTIGAFFALGTSALLIHRLGRSADPPGAILDLLAWVVASWLGRVLVYALWLWSGWHFLSR